MLHQRARMGFRDIPAPDPLIRPVVTVSSSAVALTRTLRISQRGSERPVGQSQQHRPWRSRLMKERASGSYQSKLPSTEQMERSAQRECPTPRPPASCATARLGHGRRTEYFPASGHNAVTVWTEISPQLEAALRDSCSWWPCGLVQRMVGRSFFHEICSIV